MRYFFHLEDGACIRDPKGTDFEVDAAAMHEAKKVADQLSKLPVHNHDWNVVVKNAKGVRVGCYRESGRTHGDMPSGFDVVTCPGAGTMYGNR